MSSPTSAASSYQAIYDQLLQYPPPLMPPGHLHSTELRASISDLSLHPALESALHILNVDLPSAHFLVRHMQSSPAYEAMFLHGILHRIEGDYDNARAWYSDVKDSDIFESVWDSEAKASNLIDDIEKARKGSKDEKAALDMSELGRRSLGEILRVIAFCEKKFGTERVEDASHVWVGMSEKHKEMSKNMVTGGEGWRQF